MRAGGRGRERKGRGASAERTQAGAGGGARAGGAVGRRGGGGAGGDGGARHGHGRWRVVAGNCMDGSCQPLAFAALRVDEPPLAGRFLRRGLRVCGRFLGEECERRDKIASIFTVLRVQSKKMRRPGKIPLTTSGG
ncbi:hypothetical protein EKK70_07775 [Desulfovibrio sp. DS-1]|nr:hypothetical protein EKK70_07775 [Desulfovibrio sp. DS-1]